MSDGHRERVEEILIGALDRPEAERRDFVERECAGNAELREDVYSLLDVDSELVDRLDRPPVRLLAPELEEKSIGRYEILDTLGSGGGGLVYLARRADGRLWQRVDQIDRINSSARRKSIGPNRRDRTRR